MKGSNLGEFEELVMLTIGALYPEAYGVSIKKEILEQTQRKVALSAVHAALCRLEDKGYLQSQFGEATAKRGGKRKKYFTITALGGRVLQQNREWRERLWQAIPSVVFQQP